MADFIAIPTKAPSASIHEDAEASYKRPAGEGVDPGLKFGLRGANLSCPMTRLLSTHDVARSQKAMRLFGECFLEPSRSPIVPDSSLPRLIEVRLWHKQHDTTRTALTIYFCITVLGSTGNASSLCLEAFQVPWKTDSVNHGLPSSTYKSTGNASSLSLEAFQVP